MKYRNSLILVVGLGLAVMQARGTTFEYSYRFLDITALDNTVIPGPVVTGTLEGVANGDFVVDIHNFTLAVDGAVRGGTYYGHSWEPGWVLTDTPIVSFDLWKNNFSFINSDTVNGDNSFDSSFMLLAGSPAYTPEAYFGYLTPAGEYAMDLNTLGTWSLRAVPDSGSTVLLLAGAFAMVVALGRRARA